MVQTPKAGILFLWVCRDSRVSGARGAAPCCGKAANVGQRGKQAAFSLCRQALGRAHAPVRVYKCALCTKGIIRFSRPRCVFSDSPALPRSSGQAGERRRLLRRSWSLLLAQCSQRPHPGRSADGCASCVPLGITFAATPFPDFQAAGFSSSRPQSRLAIPRVFFSLGFVMGGHSFLPVGIEKGQSISSAVLLIRVFGLLRSAQ